MPYNPKNIEAIRAKNRRASQRWRARHPEKHALQERIYYNRKALTKLWLDNFLTTEETVKILIR